MKLLIICGPTATGKTELAVQLAKKFNGELVSADSRQVYRGMDIGTGKDREKIDVPIWLYDVVNPDEEFSVSHYTKLAKHAIADISKRKKLPIIVGGTGLYIQALVEPFETTDIPPDTKLREKLAMASVEEMQSMLDPKILRSMNESDRQNPRRLMRKLEIASSLQKNLQEKPLKEKNNILMIGLTAPMPILYRRIDERVDQRLRQGMANEVRLLVKRYGRNVPAMSALGYRSLEHWKRDEHRLAKRQMTWFKKQAHIVWFDVVDAGLRSKVAEAVRAWYTEVSS